MSKFRWNLRYMFLKFGEAVRATHATLQALKPGEASPVTEKVMDQAYAEFAKTLNQRVSEVIRLVGTSMAPTLNRKAPSNPCDTELLVLRRMRGPSEENIRVGDVVAFVNPVKFSEDYLMVRRVQGVPGDVLADDKTEMVLKPGMCWVIADNQELQPPNVEDSRSFGPLEFKQIEGRVVYSIRTPTDHGPVDNSTASKFDDAPILDVEVPDILSDPELFESNKGREQSAEGELPKKGDS